ncbi:hypothetical protein BC781_1011374 [Sediminitomix flava]|uniref:Ig-like domain-containing protein n=2 Tax=Sediminitomix flava TaxID=379075 RepID=A0A315ZJH0_SEDFL|nr:hypothetical protein BC781_1011374 [Sediminitomix flava]
MLTLSNAVAQVGVKINEGLRFTKTSTVTFEAWAPGASEMLISEDFNFSDTDWQGYTPNPMPWKFSDEDGMKTLYAKFKYRDGSTSEIFTDDILLDTEAPKKGRVIITKGHYTNDRVVQVKLECKEAYEMMITNDGDFTNAHWQEFRKNLTWQLSKNEGRKTVSVKFRDRAENESEVFEDQIKYDITPPTPISIEIEPENSVFDEETNTLFINMYNREVTLYLEAKEAEFMKISNEKSFFGHKWRKYQDILEEWLLEEGDFEGYRKVYVKFMDKAKNESKPITANIYVDTKPPHQNEIRFDSETIKELTTDLTIFSNGAHEMKVSNDSTFKNVDWEPYTTSKEWELDGSNSSEDKFVYAIFRDRAKNVSERVQAHIIYDNTPPRDCSFTINDGADGTFDAHVNIKASAKDAVAMRIGLTPDLSETPWMDYTTNPRKTYITNKGGTHYIYMQFRDWAQNESEILKDSIYLWIKPTREEVRINDGSPYYTSSDPNVTLHLFANHSDKMMISNSINFEDVTPIPYQEEIDWTLEEGDGEKRVYVRFLNSTNVPSEVTSASVFVDTGVPTDCKFSINSGDEYTYDDKVLVEASAKGATAMRVGSSPNLEGIPWIHYTDKPRAFYLNPRHGLKKLYMQFMDQAHNQSEIIADSIYLVALPVRTSVRINQGAEFCNDVDGNVTLDLTGLNTSTMLVSNSEDFDNAEEIPFQKRIPWKLETGDGVKKVFVKIWNEEHNAFVVTSDEIILDGTPPQEYSFTLNNGEKSTFDEEIKLEARARGAVGMRIGFLENLEGSPWINYTDQARTVRLDPSGGIHRVFIQFKDQAGNLTPVLEDSITLLVRPIRSTVHINQGDEYFTESHGRVKLNLFSINAQKMLISNHEDFSDAEWLPYSTQVDWQLEPGDGVRTVYVRYFSKTQTSSEIISDKIIVDTTPPQQLHAEILPVPAEFRVLYYRDIQILFRGEDIAYYQISEQEDFKYAPWRPYSNLLFFYGFKANLQTGKRTLYVRMRDWAGNVSEPVSYDTFIPKKEKLPPIMWPKDIILRGTKAFTNRSVLPLTLQVKNAVKMRSSDYKGSLSYKEWKDYNPEYMWQLSGNEGVKDLYLQFILDGEVISDVYHCQVYLDKNVPSNIKLEIEDGLYCKDPEREVTLNLFAYGAHKVRISNSPDLENAPWQRYQSKMKWKLSEGDGDKTVYVQYGDFAGNISETLQQSILLDREEPVAVNFSINNDAQYTTSREVQLNIKAEEADKMWISKTPHYSFNSPWLPYKEDFKYSLKFNQEGKADLYVRFRDVAGNISQANHAQIILDLEAPVVKKLELNGEDSFTTSTTVKLTSDVLGAKYMQVSNSKNFGNEWNAYFHETDWTLEGGKGMKRVYVRFKDAAGNISKPTYAEIMLY